MRLGRIGEVPIHVPLLLLVFIGFFSLAGFGSKVLLLLTALLWHEAAHAIVAVKLGFPIEKVELTIFGGVALAPSLGEAAALDECLVAAAGPLASFFLAGIAYLLFRQVSSDLLSFYFTVNLSLALFNLLPGLPLDGGRIFRSLLALTLGYSRATALTVTVSRFIGYFLVFLVGYEFFYVHTINLTFLLAACFLRKAAKAESITASLRTMRLLAFKKERMRRLGCLPLRQLTVLSQLSVKRLVPLFRPDVYHELIIVDEEWHELGKLSEAKLWFLIQQKGMSLSFEELLKE